MANIKWLSEDGLKTVWGKVKALVAQEIAKCEKHANKVTSVVKEGEGANNDATHYPSVKAMVDYITTVKAADETTANKVSAIEAADVASTTKYTSVKSVVDYVAGEIDDMQVKSNLETSIPATPSDDKYLSTKATKTALDLKEDKSNKAESITTGDGGNSTSTTSYTSVKAVVDYVGTITSKQESTDNKTQSVDKTAKSEDKYTSEKAVAEFVATEISGKQETSNIVTAITPSSEGVTGNVDTTHYTSTKAVVDYVNDRLSAGVSYKVVDALPAAKDAEAGVIYLVPSASSKTDNTKDEYMFVGGAFEKIGTTQTDLDNYELLSNKKDAIAADAALTDANYYTAKAVNAGLGAKVNTADYLTTAEIETICDLTVE